MVSRYIFSLTVDEISLSVSTATRVALTWDTGTRQSQTWDSIVLLPGGSTPIDQKLVCHHKFSNDTVTPTPTTFKVIDAQITGKDAVLAHCSLDLADLLGRVETRHFVVPLQSALDKNAKVTLSVSVTIFSKRDDDKSATGSCATYTQSSKSKNSNPSSSGSKSPYTSSSWISRSSVTETGTDGTSQLSEQNIDKTSKSIFEKISEMESTLAQVEDEIRSDRLKLDQVSRCGGSKYTSFEASLKTDIRKKDRQIKILVTQLDEMHAALAVAHQRELERGAILLYPLRSDVDVVAYKTNSVTSQRSVPSRKHSSVSSGKVPLDAVYNKSYKTSAASRRGSGSANYEPIHTLQSPPPEIKPFQGDQIEYVSDTKAPTVNRGNHILNRPPPTVLQSNGPMLQNRLLTMRKELPATLEKPIDGATLRRIPYKAAPSAHLDVKACTMHDLKSPVKVGGEKSAPETNANRIVVAALQKSQPPSGGNVCMLTPCRQKPLATPPTTNYPKFGEAGAGLEVSQGMGCNKPAVVCSPATVKIPQISFSCAKPVLHTPTTQGNGFASDAKKHVEYLERDLIQTKVALAHCETDRERQLLELRKSIGGA